MVSLVQSNQWLQEYLYYYTHSLCRWWKRNKVHQEKKLTHKFHSTTSSRIIIKITLAYHTIDKSISWSTVQEREWNNKSNVLQRWPGDLQKTPKEMNPVWGPEVKDTNSTSPIFMDSVSHVNIISKYNRRRRSSSRLNPNFSYRNPQTKL